MEAEDQIRDLRNKVLLGVFIFIIFFIPGLAVFMTKFGGVDTKIIEKVDKEESFVVLFTKTECNYCKETKEVLKDNNINFEEVKTDSERYYGTIIRKLEISKNDIVEPTVMIIKKGKQKSSLVDINNKNELELYLKNYNLME